LVTETSQNYINGKIAGASCFTFYTDKFSVIYPSHGTGVDPVYFTFSYNLENF